LLEEIGILYRGMVLGLVIAAPVGPVGLLCIRRTLQKGVRKGLATGLGAACADVLFGAIAVLGISAIVDFIHRYDAVIRIAGGMLVLLAAWHTWHDRPKEPHPTELANKVLKLAKDKTLFGIARAFLSGFVITLTNPLTLFGTLAVVATFGEISGDQEANVLISGIFLGSALWWFLLSGGVGLMRHHFTEKRIVAVNKVTAIMLAALAVWSVASGIKIWLIYS